MSLNKYLDLLYEKLNKKQDIDEMSVTGGEGSEEYNTPGAFSKNGEEDENENAENSGYTRVKESKFKTLAKTSFLKEASYKDYKKDNTRSSKQKVNNSIKEISSKLFRMERFINQNIRLKTEEGIDNKQYWKSTRNNLYKISERMMRIGEKLRKF